MLAWHGRAGRAGSALHGPPTGHSLDLATAPWGRGCEAVGSSGTRGARWALAQGTLGPAYCWGRGSSFYSCSGHASRELKGSYSLVDIGRDLSSSPAPCQASCSILTRGPGKALDGVTPLLANDPSRPRGNCCGGNGLGLSLPCARGRGSGPFGVESPRHSGHWMYIRAVDRFEH